MADRRQRAEIERIRLYECRERELAIETFFKSVVRVADFVLAFVVMVIAMVSEIVNQMAHRVEGMAKYGEQYCQADEGRYDFI